MDMNTNGKKRIKIVMAIAVISVLIMGTLSMAFAKEAKTIEVANAPKISEYDYEPISTDGYFSNYCGFTHDAKITILDRDEYIKKETLEKKIIKKTDTEIVTYGEHDKTTNVHVTGVSGLKDVKKASLTGGYKVLPIKLQLAGADGSTTTIKTSVILVYAKEIINSDSSDSSSTGGSATSGTTNNSTAKAKPKETAKNSVSKIEEKSDDQKNEALAASVTDDDDQGGNGVDTMGVLMCSAAALAALLFAISIVPDIGVIRWFNQKKALRMKI